MTIRVFEEEDINEKFAGELQAHFIDVGQGDAILIKAIEENERHKMLIDAGQSWMGRDRVVPYLKDLDIEIIHIAVGTHPHADHIGGFLEVFDNFEVRKIVDSGMEHDTLTYENYIAAIEEHGIDFIEGRAGMEKELVKGLIFEVLNPEEPLTGDIHFENIVGQMRYNDVGFMFTGDIEADGEEAILTREIDLENDILKVAHHGSATSTTEEFLAAVDPEAAVIQVGADNRYGHPHEETIQRLDNYGVEIFRNDYHGDIVVTTDGEVYEISEDPYEPDYGEDDETTDERTNINTCDCK